MPCGPFLKPHDCLLFEYFAMVFVVLFYGLCLSYLFDAASFMSHVGLLFILLIEKNEILDFLWSLSFCVTLFDAASLKSHASFMLVFFNAIIFVL